MKTTFVDTESGYINLREISQARLMRDCVELVDRDGNLFKTKDTFWQEALWHAAELLPDTSGRCKAVDWGVIQDIDDEGAQEAYTDIYDIVGWKLLGEKCLPVVTGLDDDDSVIDLASRAVLLNTEDGSVKGINGERYDSLQAYQDAKWNEHLSKKVDSAN